MKTLDDFKFRGKVVLVRADINSDVSGGKILMSERIREAAETIGELCKKGAKVIVLAHQGRRGKKDFTNMAQHAKLLSKFCKIKFVDDIIGRKAWVEIGNLKKGEAILLDNVRFLDDEEKPGKNNLVKFFIGKVDIYVNDAFSVSHRAQTSVVSFPKYFPSCMGRVMEREVRALEKFNLKNCLYILAGGKPADDIKLVKKNRKIIAAGFFGQLILVSRGMKFGYHEEFLREFLKDEFKVVKKLRKVKAILPVDFALNVDGKRREIDLSEFPSKYRIDDIGAKTIEIFKEEIRRAGAIYVKGPLGDCSRKGFDVGTIEILKEVSKSKGFTLIGGGHLNDAIDKSKISRKKFGHISLSGGALLSYLAGEKLPGLVALEKAGKRK